MKKLLASLMLVWVMKGCYTLDDVTKLLNSLTPTQVASAKIVAINSQRSPLGMFSTPYYVWYQQ
ncbi:MAG: hypothetical protein ACREBR_05030 [bacterium]